MSRERMLTLFAGFALLVLGLFGFWSTDSTSAQESPTSTPTNTLPMSATSVGIVTATVTPTVIVTATLPVTMTPTVTATQGAVMTSTATATSTLAVTGTTSATVSPQNAICLACHGPFEKLVAATADYAWPNGEKTSPHRYLPHDSKDIPECSNCHKPHPVPLVSTEELPKPSVQWCYKCHHRRVLQCGTCHD